MPGGARVKSIDAVDEMDAALRTFRAEALAAMDELDGEIRRAVEWIEHDRKDHWEREVRRGYERVTEARVQLQLAQATRRIAERDPACVDEKKAVEHAKRRLEVAQQKVEAVRHWSRLIERAMDEYRGRRTPLASWLEIDAHKAFSTLEHMRTALEAYLAVHLPRGGAAAVAARTPSDEPTKAASTGDCPDFRVNENGTVPFDAPTEGTEAKGDSPAVGPKLPGNAGESGQSPPPDTPPEDVT
jgi:hypothetical protein